MGSSPSKKYRGATGEYWLNFRMARRTLWWNVVRVFSTGGLMGRAAKPDLKTGFTKTDHVCCCTVGESLHFYENTFPRKPNRESLAD